MTGSPNRFARMLSKLDCLPAPVRRKLTTLFFNSQVRFAGTAGLRFVVLDTVSAEVVIANRRKVRNHIKGVHAAAMALLAETATGAVFGANLRDDALPLLKSMHIDYLRRAKGALRATATLSAADRALIQEQPRGELVVPVTVTDESGAQPIQAQMTWAWIPKKPS